MRCICGLLLLAALTFRADMHVRADATSLWAVYGPDGGSITALVVDPQATSAIYAGTSVGVFKTTNAGDSWTLNSAGLNLQISDLAIDPYSGSTVYAATRNAGVFKSTDGGASWGGINVGLIGTDVRDIAIDPQTPATLYAAVISAAPAPMGLFKSTDGGETWFGSNDGQPGLGVGCLVIDPQATTTLYGCNGGVFKSVDGGTTWTPTSQTDRTHALAIDPQAPNTLYAGVEHFSVMKTIDGGLTWVQSSTGMPGYPVNQLIVDPQTPATVYAGSHRIGVYKSVDGAATWVEANTGMTNRHVRAMAIDTQDVARLYTGTVSDLLLNWRDSGVFKTSDGGANWSAINSGLHAIAVTGLAIDRQDPRNVYAGSRDGIFKSTTGGGSWAPINGGLAVLALPSPVLAPAIDPRISTTIYGGTHGAGLFRSLDAGGTWSKLTGLGAARIYELAFDPQSLTTMYAATHTYGVFKSEDAGATWVPINSWFNRQTPSDTPDVRAIAIDPIIPTTLFIGTGATNALGFRGVFKSIDGGSSWTEMGLAGLPISDLAIDPVVRTILYASSDGAPGAPGPENLGVYKSDNSGLTWSAINVGLTNRTVSALAVDPLKHATVYAGTVGGGVFRSGNGSISWNTMNNGLTVPFVYALALAPGVPITLYAGTAGGVYVMTD